jgi:hypothetical protein
MTVLATRFTHLVQRRRQTPAASGAKKRIKPKTASR